MHLAPSFTLLSLLSPIFISTHSHSSYLILTTTSLLTSSMAIIITRILLASLLAFALVRADHEPYTSRVLEGSVTCVDCPQGSDLSGLQVLVKCDQVKKLAMAYTEEDGSFATELPSDEGSPTTAAPSSCMAKIMGGPHQLFVPAKDSFTQVASAKEKSGRFTTATPLSFYRSCPQKGRCGGRDTGFASSKTVDFPLPREWGLAPSSYYVPFIPIIGIP